MLGRFWQESILAKVLQSLFQGVGKVVGHYIYCALCTFRQREYQHITQCMSVLLVIVSSPWARGYKRVSG
jgi:hypothetical protein